MTTLGKDSKHTCCICGTPFTGWGNNPAPFPDIPKSDRCCDDCNARFVIPARLMRRKITDDEVVLLRHFASMGRAFVHVDRQAKELAKKTRAAKIAESLQEPSNAAAGNND